MLLSLSLAAPSFAAGVNPTPTPKRQKFRVSDPALARQIGAQGGELIADYGSFQFFRVDDALARQLAGRPGARNANEHNIIALNTGPLDTTAPELQALRKPVGSLSGKRLHLVHFAGPVKPEWHAALTNTGVQVITYIPHNAYLIYGAGAALRQMQAWAAAAGFVQWDGDYLDDYKIHPRARTVGEKGQPQKPATDLFAVQMVDDPPANAPTLQLIDRLKRAPIRKQSRFLGYLNVIVRLPPERLKDLAARPEVISIQPYPERKKLDERQDQILAANLNGTVPVGPGYLAWLTGQGFSQAQFTASGFAVDVSDSGIDNGTTVPGHFGLYQMGSSNLPARVAYSRLEGSPNPGSTLAGCDGHGTLNAHIIGAYVNQPAGFPHTDSAGFQYGLGVCPFVKVGASVIFDPTDFTSPDYPNLQSAAYQDGVRISSNSWGGPGTGAYDVDAQSYDALVRDAQPNGATYPAPGNQQMVIVFAAGNDGPSAQTVGSPGTAKNVITVGAAQGVQSLSIANGGNDAAGNDGCSTPDSDASSANDMVSFSSRGPCADGRHKPDLVAPGTHITGGVAQNSPPPPPTGMGSALACYSGSGVCALPGEGTPGNPDNFFPLGQQFYTVSSGTSHSTPAVAGACALVRQFFLNNNLTAPSPALTKAWLMNSARYLDGASANDSLWSEKQGMGEVNLGLAFDGTTRIVRDQVAADKFTATGQTRTFTGSIADTNKPFRVTLAWTDAPGNTSGNAYNNDLDLTVVVGGNTYVGNVFSGPYSVPGGVADAQDNVESVFLPAGLSGNFLLTVTAANINSDGVPNEAPALDQDFALVVHNAVGSGPAPVLADDSFALTVESCTNGAIDPGELVTLNLGLRNVGLADTTNLVATLQTAGGIVQPTGPQSYGALLSGGPAAVRPFSFVAAGACGGTNTAILQLQDGAANLGTVSFSFPLGQFSPPLAENFDGVPAPNLPGGWATAWSGAQSPWTTSTAASDSAPNSAFSPDADAVGVNELDSVPILLPLTPVQLTFRQSYDLEASDLVSTKAYDGGVLEIQIGGGSFTDILAAGGSFVTGGYSRTISSSYSNPLAGRLAWSGNSGGFISTVVNLPAAALGQTIQLRWRCGSDDSLATTGWYIDNVTIGNYVCCSSAPVIATQPQGPLVVTGGNALLSVQATGTYPLSYRWQLNGTNLPGGTGASYAISNAQPVNAGSYSVIVSNSLGSVTSSVVALRVVVQPVLHSPFLTTTGTFTFMLYGSTGYNYAVEATTNLLRWDPVATVSNATGQVPCIQTNPAAWPFRAYRARLLP